MIYDIYDDFAIHDYDIRNFTQLLSLCKVLLESKIMKEFKILHSLGFPGGVVVKNPPANAGDTSLIPGPGRSHMLWSN